MILGIGLSYKHNKKQIFLVSLLIHKLNKGERYNILDNYLSFNYPEYNLKVHEILRKDRDAWIKYGEFVDQKEAKYFNLLVNRLNKIHNIDLSYEYWQQVVYIGLRAYITQIYEFYKQIEERFEPKKDDFKIISNESFYTPFDLRDLEEYLAKSEFAQEQLFAIYINLFYANKNTNQVTLKNTYIYSEHSTVTLKHKIKRLIYNKLQYFHPKVLLLGTHYSKENLWRLFKKSKFKIFFMNFRPYKVENLKEVDLKKRIKLCQFEEDFDDFDKFFFKTFERFCPNSLIENFNEIRKYYTKEAKRFTYLNYVVSEAWIASNQMSFFIAELRSKGVKFISSEHKGLQHPFINSIAHNLIKIPDEYYTQGWYDKNYDYKFKLVPTGLLHSIYSKNNTIRFYNNKILYMTAPVYAKKIHYNGNSFFIGEDSKYYLQFQKDFFNTLKKHTLHETIYRGASALKRDDFLLYDQHLILKNYIKEMTIDNLKYTGIDAMTNAKIVVIDYLGSGYLEALLNNVPTILFLYQNCYLADSQKEIFNELIEVGIMQTDAKKAAVFLEEIENNPLKWWLRDDVQKAKDNFINSVIGDGKILEEKLLMLAKE